MAGSTQIDVSAVLERAKSQFSNLDPNQPGQWPLIPKVALALFVAAAVVTLGWFLFLADAHSELEAERAKEPPLRADYRAKLAQAVNLEALQKQKQQVQEYVTQLEKQLPGKAEMDALLSDINQAGLGRGLQFELFRPGQLVTKDYYAELPISIKVTGKYHDIGAFAADISNLSRIVTLHELAIQAVSAKDTTGTLSMDATARTYRYLDAAEVEKVKAAKAGAAKPGAKK